MNNYDDDSGHAAQMPAPPALRHAEPQAGGSYTRDIDTGALIHAAPAPADQPEQE